MSENGAHPANVDDITAVRIARTLAYRAGLIIACFVVIQKLLEIPVLMIAELANCDETIRDKLDWGRLILAGLLALVLAGFLVAKERRGLVRRLGEIGKEKRRKRCQEPN